MCCIVDNIVILQSCIDFIFYDEFNIRSSKDNRSVNLGNMYVCMYNYDDSYSEFMVNSASNVIFTHVIASSIVPVFDTKNVLE
jgi:hypothetical protein